jgi:hypothetical protein
VLLLLLLTLLGLMPTPMLMLTLMPMPMPMLIGDAMLMRLLRMLPVLLMPMFGCSCTLSCSRSCS